MTASTKIPKGPRSGWLDAGSVPMLMLFTTHLSRGFNSGRFHSPLDQTGWGISKSAGPPPPRPRCPYSWLQAPWGC